MTEVLIIGLFGFIRIFTLTGERIALNQLGQARYGSLATMGVGFGGATLILWFMTWWTGGDLWVASTLWTGAIYAIGFGFYTAALASGPVSLVSPWSNATVLIIWMLHPTTGLLAWVGLVIFAGGALLLSSLRITYPVVSMLVGDAFLAIARLKDVHQVHQSSIAYATSLFTVISAWMFMLIIVSGRAVSVVRLVRREPGWSFVAASSNAAAYLAVFNLLRWLHPAAVEALSSVASSVAALTGVYVFHEEHGKRKTVSALLMTLGTILLLCSQ